MLARCAGWRNFQHLRAESRPEQPAPAAPTLAAPEPAPQADPALLKRLRRYFDQDGRLVRWPGKFSHRLPCLWAIWARIPAGRDLAEPEVNRLVAGLHLFGDHALLRRELCDRGLVQRTPDGRRYRRLERRPPPEALALIGQLGRAG
jgi:hypothetical protein